MPFKDPQKRYAKDRRWLAAYPSYMRLWQQKNPEKVLEYRRRNREKVALLKAQEASAAVE